MIINSKTSHFPDELRDGYSNQPKHRQECRCLVMCYTQVNILSLYGISQCWRKPKRRYGERGRPSAR